jgi:hypothetical protein
VPQSSALLCSGNSNAGQEFNDGPKGNGVIGPKLSEEE